MPGVKEGKGTGILRSTRKNKAQKMCWTHTESISQFEKLHEPEMLDGMLVTLFVLTALGMK